MTFPDFSTFESLQKSVEIANSLEVYFPPDPLPDYTQSNGSYVVEDLYFRTIPFSREHAFHLGVASALAHLGANETMPQDELVKLARAMIHEARHRIKKLAKEATNF